MIRYENEHKQKEHKEGIVLVKHVQDQNEPFKVLHLLKTKRNQTPMCQTCSDKLQRPEFHPKRKCPSKQTNIITKKFGANVADARPDKDRTKGMDQLTKHNQQETVRDKIVACRKCTKLFVSQKNADKHMLDIHALKQEVMYANLPMTSQEEEDQNK